MHGPGTATAKVPQRRFSTNGRATTIKVDHDKERYMKKHASRYRLRLGKRWGVMEMTVLLLMSYTSVVVGGTTGQVIDDSIITTKVKSSFVADQTVSAFEISVETTQGVVSLTGLVDNEKERQQAIQIAQGIEGVKQVNARNLVVKR
jgi:hypothetical protein